MIILQVGNEIFVMSNEENVSRKIAERLMKHIHTSNAVRARTRILIHKRVNLFVGMNLMKLT